MPREDPEVQNINDQVRSLPGCPSCGYLTRLDRITVRLTAGGKLVTYVLRCVNSITHGREPGFEPCSFVVSMNRG
jgi:hypothetical protein